MKILVVGAGAIGGYFGGRLLEKGEDVTFLVRERRKRQLEETGLNIESINGDVRLMPKLITKEEHTEEFDIVLVSTKSYQLQAAIDDLRPFVKEGTMVLPLLNGIAHIDALVEAFGEEAVLGGLCFIESTLDEKGIIVQASSMNQLVYGERNGKKSERINRLKEVFEGTKADIVLSSNINQEMWHKYFFITAMSGITSMMASPIGPIRELETGQRTIAAFMEELAAIMKRIGAPIKDNIVEEQLAKLNMMAHGMKTSMQRDMEKAQPIEADHLQGYLWKKGKEAKVETPILETIYTKLLLYQKKLEKIE